MSKRLFLVVCGWLVMAVLSAQTLANLTTPIPKNLPTETLYTFWTAQSQYAGYILAETDGMYRLEGLDVKVTHYDGTAPLDMLRSGKAHFVSLSLLDAAYARSQGVRLVNVLQYSNESSFVVVANRPIYELNDLKGKEVVTYRDFNPPIKRRLKQLLNDSITIDEVFSCVEAFLSGAYDYLICTSYNEYIAVVESGYPIHHDNVLYLSDQGLDIPEDGIYVMESYLRKYPERVEAFIRASIRGWEKTVWESEYSIGRVLERMERDGIPHNRYHERSMLKEMHRLHGDYPQGQGYTLQREAFDRAVSLLSPHLQTRISFETFAR